MPWFRMSAGPANPAQRLNARRNVSQVRSSVEESLRPAHFFTGGATELAWEHVTQEETSWEIYHGRLLDPAHTRLRQTFEAWHVFLVDGLGRSAEPILSVRLDASAGRLYVTRAIYCHAWEGYHAGDNVYLSRETRKWVRELVASLDLGQFHGLEDLQDELACRLFQAVVGVSRLPLTSVEAPLPAFSLGQLAYFLQPTKVAGAVPAHPMSSHEDLIARGLHAGLAPAEKCKLLEMVLRSTVRSRLGEAARLFTARWSALGHTTDDFLSLLRALFNEVALSPYTDFVDRALLFLRALTAQAYLSFGDLTDLLGYLLRQLARHLTAYDLLTFHHRGANYPDALMLDAILKTYLDLAEDHPELFHPAAGDAEREQEQKRIRRRALRQGWMLRRFYEGLPVPASPTSPGENARVLPPPHVRVPEEEIYDPSRRTCRLFEADPLAAYLGERGRAILRLAVQDLRHPFELRELGMAVFLDRPLGVFKAPHEPDHTLLLSYEAFSRSLAARRLRLLAGELGLIPGPDEGESYLRLLDALPVAGLPPEPGPGRPRPDAVSLQDALQAAEDFILLRTTRKSVREFLARFDCRPLAKRFCLDWLVPEQAVLLVRGPGVRGAGEDVLAVYDSQLRKRLELQVDPQSGYASRAGLEYPRAGLQVLRAWVPEGTKEEIREYALRPESLMIPPHE